ncbi:MAG TPA: hypothetical protein GX697_06650 [Firmicutes bacterium]|nr:hypothetical protein [Bacillota bacterium]
MFGGKILLVLLLLQLLQPGVTVAANREKLVLIAVDRLSFSDLAAAGRDLANINRLLTEGAIGLMNTATAGTLNSENAYATIGAGARALGGASSALSFETVEVYQQNSAADLYYRRYGRYPRKEGVVFLGLGELDNKNTGKNYRILPGALGELLAQKGITRGVIGNADTASPRRFAPLILADREGFAGTGVLSSEKVLIGDPTFPFGLRVDAEKYLEAFTVLHKDKDVLILEWGDFYRLDEERSLLSPERYRELFQSNLVAFDYFLEGLFKSLAPGTEVIFFVPTPPRVAAGSGNALTPVVFWSEAIPGGLLVSGSTRRPGLITNLDLSASVLAFFELEKPYYMQGEEIIPMAFENPVPYLAARLREINRVYTQRPRLIQSYIFLQIIAVFASLWLILKSFTRAALLKPLLLAMLLVPLALLYLPLLPPWSLFPTIAAVFGFSLLLGAALDRLFTFPVNMALIGLFTSLSLLVDVFRQSPLIKTSFLGYDPVAGARYYGIGNEYMGVLIGSALLGIAAALQYYAGSRKKLLILQVFFFFYYCLVVYSLASPALGANFGGTLTALAAGAAMIITVIGKRRKTILAVGIMAAVVLVFFFWLNLPGEGRFVSHWGKSLAAIKAGGIKELVNIIVRKAVMNVRLLRYSLWSRILLSLFAVQGVLLFRPKGVMKKLKSRYPYFVKGLTCITIGAAVSFITNDSGVVAAALLLLYSGLPLLMLIGLEGEQPAADNNLAGCNAAE